MGIAFSVMSLFQYFSCDGLIFDSMTFPLYNLNKDHPDCASLSPLPCASFFLTLQSFLL